MVRRRFHRISYPENNTFYSFNPERIETVHMEPNIRPESSSYKIIVVMGSGTEHTISRTNWEDALAIFCNLSGAPPPTSGFDDVSKSYFPGS